MKQHIYRSNSPNLRVRFWKGEGKDRVRDSVQFADGLLTPTDEAVIAALDAILEMPGQKSFRKLNIEAAEQELLAGPGPTPAEMQRRIQIEQSLREGGITDPLQIEAEIEKQLAADVDIKTEGTKSVNMSGLAGLKVPGK